MGGFGVRGRDKAKKRLRELLVNIPVLGFPCGSVGKESACNAGDLGSIPGLGRSPGAGKGYPLQYSGLENSMDCIVHGVAKSGTQLGDFRFTWLLHSFLPLKSHQITYYPLPKHSWMMSCGFITWTFCSCGFDYLCCPEENPHKPVLARQQVIAALAHSWGTIAKVCSCYQSEILTVTPSEIIPFLSGLFYTFQDSSACFMRP